MPAMMVRDVMQTRVLTIAPDTTLPEAVRLAGERGVRHLPVLHDGKLVGLVSDRDLKRAMASSATSLEVHELNYLVQRLAVREFMTRTIITVRPNCPVKEAARLMLLHKIGALPVTDGEALVGIVTETDLLKLLVTAGEPPDDRSPGGNPDRDATRA
jgi:acetoin utilization protein AcuB